MAILKNNNDTIISYDETGLGVSPANVYHVLLATLKLNVKEMIENLGRIINITRGVVVPFLLQTKFVSSSFNTFPIPRIKSN